MSRSLFRACQTETSAYGLTGLREELRPGGPGEDTGRRLTRGSAYPAFILRDVESWNLSFT